MYEMDSSVISALEDDVDWFHFVSHGGYDSQGRQSH
jgi:hypothetical protein